MPTAQKLKCNDIQYTPIKISKRKKKLTMSGVGKDVNQLDLIHFYWECKIIKSFWRIVGILNS